VLALGVIAGCSSSSSVESESAADVVDAPKIEFRDPFPDLGGSSGQPTPIRFREASEEAGVDFVHDSGKDEERYFPTANGSGVSIIDYDKDGWLDLYFTTTRRLPLDVPSKSEGNRLFRNRGDGTFEDVTETAGVGIDGFTHTAAVGDLDGNGFDDLLLTTFGPLVLFLNNGDGTFQRVESDTAFDTMPHWSSGAAVLDYDLDGDLDVYISCYSDWDFEDHEFCGDRERGVRNYCSPTRINPSRDYLYRNNGDATFTDVTESAGILRSDGRGMGVLTMDVNDDALVDLYVANDLSPNYLFLNHGDGTFEDVSELSGTSASESGANQAGMGVDGADIDGDGRPELFVTNFREDYNTLYKNLDGENFQDITTATNTVADCVADVGWGCSLADFDLDGHPDMLVVNGHVDDNLHLLGLPGVPQPEKPKVWWGGEGLRFERAAEAGPYFERAYVSRGAAFGDLDNDGDTDAIVSHMDEPAGLLINESETGNWLGFELIGPDAGIGAKVTALVGDESFTKFVKGGGSYHSANDRRVVFGLGARDRVDRVEIRWPGGAVQTIEAPDINRYHPVERDQRADAAETGAGEDEPS